MRKNSAAGSAGGVRLLRVFSRLNVGGPSVHVILLAAGLEARGYDTRLVVGFETEREGNLLGLAAEKGVECFRMQGLGREIRPLLDLRSLWRLYRLMREYRPSIVHTHTAKAGLLGRVAALMARVPIVVHTYHGHVLRAYFGPVKTAAFRLLETGLGRVSDVLVAVSEAVKQDLVSLGVAPASKIRVIPLGLELSGLEGELPRGRLRDDALVPEGAPLVGVVGRLVPVKDVTTFLRAARIVRQSLPECRFAVVGDGEERRQLEAEASRLGLGGAVHFHGWRRDMDGVYGGLDLVVNCSLNEGTPVALIEAMAAARPVVATRVGGTPDLLGDGARGDLVEPRDPEALARAILGVLRSPEGREARAKEARQYVLSLHSSGRLIGDIDALYRELLAPAGVA